MSNKRPQQDADEQGYQAMGTLFQCFAIAQRQHRQQQKGQRIKFKVDQEICMHMAIARINPHFARCIKANFQQFTLDKQMLEPCYEKHEGTLMDFNIMKMPNNAHYVALAQKVAQQRKSSGGNTSAVDLQLQHCTAEYQDLERCTALEAKFGFQEGELKATNVSEQEEDAAIEEYATKCLKSNYQFAACVAATTCNEHLSKCLSAQQGSKDDIMSCTAEYEPLRSCMTQAYKKNILKQ